jgi:hypothetical protein
VEVAEPTLEDVFLAAVAGGTPGGAAEDAR